MLNQSRYKGRTGEVTLARRDRQIVIVEPIIEDGDSNEDKVTGYQPISSDPRPYARVENGIGDTVVEQDQVKHVQQTIFTVLYRDDVTIKNRIVHEGKMYTILSVIELGEVRRRFTKISGEYLKDYIIT
jgi:head-tail adaptor